MIISTHADKNRPQQVCVATALTPEGMCGQHAYSRACIVVRQVFWLVGGCPVSDLRRILPGPVPSGIVSPHSSTYSSGNCSRFSRLSLFRAPPLEGSTTVDAAKVVKNL